MSYIGFQDPLYRQPGPASTREGCQKWTSPDWMTGLQPDMFEAFFRTYAMGDGLAQAVGIGEHQAHVVQPRFTS
jgi:hypothetical protein